MPPFAKRMIKSSFIKLLNERPISQITVKEIVDDCGVNRNSFYYHFQDIPSLLEEIVVELADKVIASQPEDASFEEQISGALNQIVKHKRAIYHIIRGSNSNSEFYELQLMRICEYVTRSYINSRDYSVDVPEEDMEYIVNFMKNLTFGQIMDWIYHDMSYDIAEHSTRLYRMFAGSIRAVCLRCSQ